jgi:predicted CopG family antitoxin
MRMISIEVDEEVYRALQRWARPFEDTPNTVLRRLLGLDKPPSLRLLSLDKPKRLRRAARGKGLPQSAYRLPILEALGEISGKGRVKDVLKRVYEKVKHQLTPIDLQKVPSGADIRWRNRARWERRAMIRDGLLRDNSPTGIWEMTDKGWEYLHRHVGTEGDR